MIRLVRLIRLIRPLVMSRWMQSLPVDANHIPTRRTRWSSNFALLPTTFSMPVGASAFHATIAAHQGGNNIATWQVNQPLVGVAFLWLSKYRT